MNYEIITAPVIGAVIGTVTNGIAIKMLFRPWKPIYIGKFQVPFTPGLIPKEKPRLAKAIANVVGNNLLDSGTIKETLLSDEMKEKLSCVIERKITSLSESTQSVAGFLEERGIMSTIDEKESTLKDTAAQAISQKLVSINVSASIVDFASEELLKNANPMIAGIASKAISSARDSIISKINEIISEKAPEIISELIDSEYEKIKEKPVNEFTSLLTEKFPDYNEQIWKIYNLLIEKYLDQILRGFNINKIVEQKINDFELPELERLIMEISKKELNSLVALGGLLGLLMGFVNVFI